MQLIATLTFEGDFRIDSELDFDSSDLFCKAVI